MPNSVIFYLPKVFVELIKNKNVVIKEIGNEIIIREAIIDDVRTIKVNSSSRRVTYTTFRDKERNIGEYEYEIKGDLLILYR